MTITARTRGRATSAPSFDREDVADEVAAFAMSGPFAMSRMAFTALAGGLLAPAAMPSQSAGAEFGRIAFVQDGIVSIPVHGLLVTRDSWLTLYGHATSFESILQDATQAMAAPSVRGIVLEINSAGGEFVGCWEVVEGLLALRGTKPLEAHVRGDGLGAAYWIAAATDRIHAADTAILGDLGLQASYWDDSEWLDRVGLAEIIVTSSQTPAKNAPPTTPDGRGAWQRTLDDLTAVMLGSIARARGTTVAALQRAGGDGAVFVGARAVSLGLADALGDVDTVATSVRQAVAARAIRRTTATSTRSAPRTVARPAAAAPAPPVTPAPTHAERILAVLRLINPRAVITPAK